jgi:DNA-binding transcriptional LysR family regulator
MDFHHLNAVVTVADERNFSRAAIRLHTSQPSLSQLMKRIEKELGAELFDRRAQPLALTKAGEVFIPRARRLMADYNNVIGEVRTAGVRSEVTVGATPMLSNLLIPDLLNHVLQLKLPLTINPLESTSRELVDLLARGLIDLAVLSHTALPEGFAYEPLAWSGFKVALHHDMLADFPDANIHLNDLLTKPLILPKTGGVRSCLNNFFASHGAKPRVVYESSSVETILGLADAGLGVAFILEPFVTPQRLERYSRTTFASLEEGPEPLALGIASRSTHEPMAEPVAEAKSLIGQSVRRLFPAFEKPKQANRLPAPTKLPYRAPGTQEPGTARHC